MDKQVRKIWSRGIRQSVWRLLELLEDICDTHLTLRSPFQGFEIPSIKKPMNGRAHAIRHKVSLPQANALVILACKMFPWPIILSETFSQIMLGLMTSVLKRLTLALQQGPRPSAVNE
jgi:hypothetical protein